MNEANILKTIQSVIGNNFIGDDCAYLKDLGIVVSQDSLIEGIHFKREWYTPFQLGYKSIVVNISDILASGAVPEYVTIALSLPNNLGSEFVKQFYLGVNHALKNAKVVGGDITGSPDKIVISVTAIGVAGNRNISSRKNAKSGYVIITKGFYGSSSAGLEELLNNGNKKDLINMHISPILDYGFSKIISETVKEPYAMMDTSDGLADALFKIAEVSNVKIVINYDKVKHLQTVTYNQVLFGGEDYNLIAAIPEKYLSAINNTEDIDIIGYVSDYDGVRLDISGDKFSEYKELNVYNHFGDKNE